MAVDKKRLLKARLPESEIDVGAGVGYVRVRGLSRIEVLTMQERDTSAPGAFERVMLAMALVDPALTEDEVAQWQAASTAGELEPVTEKVSQLSGLKKDAAKDAYKEFESDPDAEFRVPPGGAPGDDGGEAEG